MEMISCSSFFCAFYKNNSSNLCATASSSFVCGKINCAACLADGSALATAKESHVAESIETSFSVLPKETISDKSISHFAPRRARAAALEMPRL